jgi:hypothetical protein
MISFLKISNANNAVLYAALPASIVFILLTITAAPCADTKNINIIYILSNIYYIKWIHSHYHPMGHMI